MWNGEIMLNVSNSVNREFVARYQKLDLTNLCISDDEFIEVVNFFKCLKKIRDEQVVVH